MPKTSKRSWLGSVGWEDSTGGDQVPTRVYKSVRRRCAVLCGPAQTATAALEDEMMSLPIGTVVFGIDRWHMEDESERPPTINRMDHWHYPLVIRKPFLMTSSIGEWVARHGPRSMYQPGATSRPSHTSLASFQPRGR